MAGRGIFCSKLGEARQSLKKLSKEAQQRINQIEEMLEQKEIYIADFYFKTKDYTAAKARYEDVLKTLKNEQEKSRILARIEESDRLIKSQTN